MDGDLITLRIPGDPTPINFAEIMFVTESRVALPIEFFLRRCLIYIAANQAGGLPTSKGILLEGEVGKHPNIIDIDALHKDLDTKPGCLTYAQFLEARENMIEFQKLRDVKQGGGSWTALWKEHFNFFTSQDDSEKYYPSWKTMEAE
ncbi:hypothetical protein BJ165DRAFT_1323940, partial [Panaeolus papilionaceus]